MGIPYSRQINAAFDQVTPLVAAAYQVLQTTKNISILLAVIQILTVVFLGAILLTLLAILVSINPGLEDERDALVTPAVKWGCEVLTRMGRGVAWVLWLGVVGGMAGVGAGGLWLSRRADGKVTVVREGEEGEDVEEEVDVDEVEKETAEAEKEDAKKKKK